MSARLFEGSSNGQVDVRVYNVEGDFHQHTPPVEVKSLSQLLRPVTDASHARDRTRSPPDSACLPGTRKVVVKSITTWASRRTWTLAGRKSQHVLWMYGFAGSGKSSVAQEVSERVHKGRRLLASFFFCRNAGYRSTMARLPNTLANQLAEAIPQAAQLIGTTVREEPALVKNTSNLSLDTRLHRMVFGPFKAALPLISYSSHPYLIVIDGLDECEDKDGVEEFLNSILRFFNENPYIPLRIFITSRVEQHIQPLLSGDRVLLKDLGNDSPRDDIIVFLDLIFDNAIKANPVIQAYIRQNGPWPKPPQVEMLLKHINGSFILASTLAKFILYGSSVSDSHLTPIDRLPLAVEINPGLDGLYTQTLTRAEDRPHFCGIISTIALLAEPLPISGIAELLDIQTYEVIHVLVSLQAIIHVPGTDNAPITICHTSLRDFLTTESRSGRFFVPPSFHVRLLVHCLNCELRIRRQQPKVEIEFRQQTSAVRYSLEYREPVHWMQGQRALGSTEFAKLVELRREMLELLPDRDKAGGLTDLGSALHALFCHSGLTPHIEEALSVHREALGLRPRLHPDRHWSLWRLGGALASLFEHSGSIPCLEEAIPVLREALSLRPHSHPERPWALYQLGRSLLLLHEYTNSVSHIQEATAMLREALRLRPHPHPERHWSLYSLGYALASQIIHSHVKSISYLEEAIPLLRETISLRPHPNPDRHQGLHLLGTSLVMLYDHTGTHFIPYIEEAIPVLREALSLRPHPHPDRHWSLQYLGYALTSQFIHTPGKPVSHIEEAISILRESLSLRPHPHPQRHLSLNNLGFALNLLFSHTKSISHLQEVISTHSEALSLRPSSHPDRPSSLDYLGCAMYSLFTVTGSVPILDKAISFRREALSHRPPPPYSLPYTLTGLIEFLETRYEKSQSTGDLDEAVKYGQELVTEHYPQGHTRRSRALDKLQSVLQKRFNATGNQEDLDEIEKLKGERTN